jgi:hypothetical protein
MSCSSWRGVWVLNELGVGLFALRHVEEEGLLMDSDG